MDGEKDVREQNSSTLVVEGQAKLAASYSPPVENAKSTPLVNAIGVVYDFVIDDKVDNVGK